MSASSSSTNRVAEDDERRLRAFLGTLCDANAYLDVVSNMEAHVERSEFLLTALSRTAAFDARATRLVHIANRHSGLFACGARRLLEAPSSIVSVCGRQSIVDVVGDVLARNARPGDVSVQLVQSRVLALDDLEAIFSAPISAGSPPPIVVLDLFSGVGLGDGALRVAALLHARAKAAGAPVTIVPARMRLLAMGVDLSIGRCSGFDFAEFDGLKRAEASLGWIATPLHELPEFKRMTAPVELFSIAFDAPPALPLKAHLASVPVKQCGTITALLCWFELADASGATLASFGVNDAHAKPRTQCVFALREPVRVTDAHDAAVVIEASLSSTMMFVNATPCERGSPHVSAVALQRRAPPVPQWHWVMLGDAHRNALYEAALCRALQMREPQNRTVLDIGGGSGLLSMMAARAGAERVVCVESTPHMAQLARDIVAANGHAAAVSVIDVHSSAVQVGAQLARPADVLVTEIFDYQLLGESCLATLADCHARGLVAPNASVIPRGAVVYAQLIEVDHFGAVPLRFPDGAKHAFDASAFATFYANCAELSWNGIRLEHERNVKLLSEVFVPFTFDFTAAGAAKLTEPRDTVMRVPIRRSGTFNAVVFFFHLQMDSEARLSTSPGASRAWCQGVQHMSVPLSVTAGSTFDIACLHDANRFVFVDAEQRSGPPGGPVAQPPPKWLVRLQNRERLAQALGSSELGIAPRSRPPAMVLALLRSMSVRQDFGFDNEVVHRLLQNVLTWSA